MKSWIMDWQLNLRLHICLMLWANVYAFMLQFLFVWSRMMSTAPDSWSVSQEKPGKTITFNHVMFGKNKNELTSNLKNTHTHFTRVWEGEKMGNWNYVNGIPEFLFNWIWDEIRKCTLFPVCELLTYLLYVFALPQQFINNLLINLKL